MKLSRTIVFILLFAGVVAIYFFQARLTQQTLTILPDEVNRTVTLSKNDPINRVELNDPGQKMPIVLQKESGAWMLERPVHYPAESQIVEGFLIAARMASRQPRLRVEKEWGEYGLEKPEVEIRFVLPGKRVVTLQIGAQAPVGKAVFARWVEERGFFLLPVEMKAMFRQTVYGLRQKKLFRAPVDGIRKVFVEMGTHSYQWKKDEGQWYWFEPVEKLGRKVQAGSMDFMLQGLQSLHVREFLDGNKKSKAELGFFMIHDLIRVESEGGKVETFYFGNEIPEQNAYYGFLEGEGVVFLVDRAKVIQFFDLLKTMGAEDGKPKAAGVLTRDIGKEIAEPHSPA